MGEALYKDVSDNKIKKILKLEKKFKGFLQIH